MPDRAAQSPKRFAPNDPLLKAVRRVTLLAFAGALIAMAILGVFVLLYFASGRVTRQILGSLLIIACCSGVILAAAHGASRRLGPQWFFWSAIGLTIGCTGLVLVQTWLNLPNSTWPGAPTVAFSAGAVLAAWPSAFLFHRGRWRRFALSGLVISVVSSVIMTLDAWIDLSQLLQSYTLRDQILSMSLFSMCAVFQTGVLGVFRPGTVPAPLLAVSVALGWLLAGYVSYMFILEVERDESYLRVFGVLAVLNTSAFLLSLVVSVIRIDRSKATGPDAPLITELELVCPVCATSQRVKVGDDRCTTCACRFQFRVTPADCPGCGYSLADLPERKCPECGVRF